VTPDLTVLLAVLGIALATMPVYALSAARAAADPHEVAEPGSFVFGSFVRGWFYWFIAPLVRISLALEISPTFFNLLGVAFGIGAGAAFATGQVTVGGWCILLGGTADVFDGRIARARVLANDRGAFLDSTLDRFAEVGAFVGLAVLFRDSALALALVVVALGGSLLVSYARARGESLGVLCKLGIMQRAERLLLIGFASLFDPTVTRLMGWEYGTLLLGALGLVAIGTLGTAIFRTIWIARRLS
jgi:CDP-diacylglycerol--glycerol-3-phosphate 3-phosphatidyltransferase